LERSGYVFEVSEAYIRPLVEWLAQPTGEGVLVTMPDLHELVF